MKGKASPDTGRTAAGTINCYSCTHFYITYEKIFPYGCRAMGFKSRLMPSREVFASSGMECQMFESKQRNSL